MLTEGARREAVTGVTPVVSKGDRLQQATQYLQDHALDGLIAASNGVDPFLDPHVVHALAGVRPIGESVLVLDREGRSTLIATPAWDAERMAVEALTDDTIGTDDLVPTLVGVLAAHRVHPTRAISIGLSRLGLGVFNRIAAALCALPAEADELARDLARICTADELAAATHAVAIAERGYERLLELARPGMREFELAAEVYCHMKRLGAEDNFLLLSASQHDRAVRVAGERVLVVGDIILAEITPCYRGQFAQICRTAVIGEPRPVVAEKFALLQHAMQRGLDAAGAGARIADVASAIDAVFRQAGHGAYCRPPYMRVRGHHLGITSGRPGGVGCNGGVLESGMVLVLHSNQYVPESGYLMCGETVVVTDAGARSLSARRARLDVIAG